MPRNIPINSNFDSASRLPAFRFPRVFQLSVEAVFAVLPLFLFAALFPLLALFATVAHGISP
jgi:hypothetical protein